MIQIPLNNTIKRVHWLSLILIFISTFSVLIFGRSTQTIHNEIKQLEDFLLSAKDIQPNFERSLLIYTEETQNLIEFLLSLRPSSEVDYIGFISQVEAIGQKLSLNLDLESIEKIGEMHEAEKTLDYSIHFFGNEDQLLSFLMEIEKLPYFIKVYEVDFAPLNFSQNDKDNAVPNINLKIKLYVK